MPTQKYVSEIALNNSRGYFDSKVGKVAEVVELGITSVVTALCRDAMEGSGCECTSPTFCMINGPAGITLCRQSIVDHWRATGSLCIDILERGCSGSRTEMVLCASPGCSLPMESWKNCGQSQDN